MNRSRTQIFVKYFHNLSETGFFFENAIYSCIREFLSEKNFPQTIVIDFGCGQKPLEYLFGGFSGKYIGLDVYQGEYVDLVYDGSLIPVDDKSVDLVFSTSVFEHVENLDLTLKEIFRILKTNGQLLAVVPFTNHVHGTPFDYHRPTRYGWESKLKQAFGETAFVQVTPVDNRLSCLINLVTSQINIVLLDLMRHLNNIFFKENTFKRNELTSGGASPESKASTSMKVAYALVRLNPINFILGLFSWMFFCSFSGISYRSEGEITVGYLIKVVK